MGNYPDRAAAWQAVVRYLLAERWHEAGGGLAPYGHTKPAARYGDTTIVNDAETITIFET